MFIIIAFITNLQNYSSSLSSNKSLQKNYQEAMSTTNQLMDIIDNELRGLKKEIKAVNKMKGEARRKTAETIKASMKKTEHLIGSFETTITLLENKDNSSDQIHTFKEQLHQYQDIINTFKKNLEFSRNQKLTQQELFQARSRRQKESEPLDREKAIQECFKVQQRGNEHLKEALKNLYEMDEIANTVNVQLQNQMQKLDSIYATLEDTNTVMKRAQRHIMYFARSVYTDKLLIGLIVLILIAIIVIVVLSAMGKIPSGPASDILK